MKPLKLHLIFFVAMVIMVSGTPLAFAQQEPQKIKARIEMKSGDEVTFFYGGTAIEKCFPVGAVMKVYEKVQAFGLNEKRRIGKVRILSHEGPNYFKAQVIEGRIGPGDVVKLKPGASPAGMACPPMQ